MFILVLVWVSLDRTSCNAFLFIVPWGQTISVRKSFAGIKKHGLQSNSERMPRVYTTSESGFTFQFPDAYLVCECELRQVPRLDGLFPAFHGSQDPLESTIFVFDFPLAHRSLPVEVFESVSDQAGVVLLVWKFGLLHNPNF